MIETVYLYWVETRLLFRGEALRGWERAKGFEEPDADPEAVRSKLAARRKVESDRRNLYPPLDYAREFRLCRQSYEVIE